jgi:hypothetical protein
MYPQHQEKTAFITDFGVYSYNVMPFGLKNTGATYQHMMNLVFSEQIGHVLEMYIDDIIVKTNESGDLVADLEDVFQQLRRYNLRLNPHKCNFGVEEGKLLVILLTSRGIEDNPDKCKAILEMASPRSIREVQQLTGRVAALSWFLPISSKKCLPLFKALRNKEEFVWD